MLLALEGIAGASKSTLRDRLLADAHSAHIALGHIGQFSWLSLKATRTLIGLRAGHPHPHRPAGRPPAPSSACGPATRPPPATTPWPPPTAIWNSTPGTTSPPH
ncbi:hypothetical protein [Streptomyces sp. NPDC018352]|uniref:hypothetical protein n=1 Tax=Streptomyces sp. NPDC018352 TaxID=3157194 RepID=UPI00340960AA